MLQVGLYWVVFSLGLKLGTGTEVSFGILLIAGMVPWFAFSDSVSGMAGSIASNGALVKRIRLPVGMLPVSGLIAAMATHAIIVVLIVFFLWGSGYPPSLRLLALPYFALALTLFSLALGTLLALANAAFRDTSQLLVPVLLLWFWATPIIWPAAIVPPDLAWILWINPVNHIIEGYRWAMLGSAAASPDAAATVSFWTLTAALGVMAWICFRSFKSELADLL